MRIVPALDQFRRHAQHRVRRDRKPDSSRGTAGADDLRVDADHTSLQVEQRPAESEYTFYDGSPFATGSPHYGHILQGVVKDIVPRYWTMRGHRVERRFGWDTHGLPVERTVEKALYARRLLLTGRQVPEVYATEVAREHADASIAELDEEIDSLLFETRVRREVVSDTVAVLLQRAAARRQSSLQVPQVSPVDPRPLNRGRVQ